MFYLYSTPTCIEQKIHNCLAKGITVVGKCLGVLWIKRSKDGPYYTRRHDKKRFWCYLTNFIVILLCFCVIYYEMAHHKGLETFLVGAMAKLTIICYYFLIIVFLTTVMVQERAFVKSFNLAYELHLLNQLLFKSNRNLKNNFLFYKFLIKTGFDLIMSFIVIVLSNIPHIYEPTSPKLVFTFLLPTSLGIYCFIGTIYYILLAYALFLGQRAHHVLKTTTVTMVDISNMTSFYLKIVRFVRKVNKTLQFSLLLLVLHAFMGFVTQVNYGCP